MATECSHQTPIPVLLKECTSSEAVAKAVDKVLTKC